MPESVPALVESPIDFNDCESKAQFRWKSTAHRAAVRVKQKEGYTILARVKYCRRHDCFHIHVDHMALRREERERRRRVRVGKVSGVTEERERRAREASVDVAALLAAGRSKVTWFK